VVFHIFIAYYFLLLALLFTVLVVLVAASGTWYGRCQVIESCFCKGYCAIAVMFYIQLMNKLSIVIF